MSVPSAWNASSPVETVKAPPVTVMSPLEWNASSAQSMAKLPPSTVRAVPALTPLALLSSARSWPLAEPPPEVTVKVPLRMAHHVSACMPSSPEVMVTSEPDMVTKPASASVSLVERSPSPPHCTVMSASTMVLESLPFMPWFTALTVMEPS